MINIEEIKRTKVSSGEYTDKKNTTHNVVNSVINPPKVSLYSAEEKIVEELYNIFKFRPRSKGKA